MAFQHDSQGRRHKDIIGPSKFLTPDEQKQLWEYLYGKRPNARGRLFRCDSIAGRRCRMIIQVLMFCGLRESELAALRVCDTPGYLSTPCIEVYRGKGNKDRQVTMSPEITKALNNYITTIRPRTMPRWIKRSDIKQPVFWSQAMRPYKRQTTIIDKKTGKRYISFRASSALYRMVHRLGQAAGLNKPLHPHMFRHTYAMNAIDAGENIRTLQDLMGHNNLSMTERYLHAKGLNHDAIGSRISQVFRGTVPAGLDIMKEAAK